MSSLPTNAEVINRFASVAQAFCSVIDTAPTLDRLQLLIQVYKILPQLIGEATSLPVEELDDDDTPEQEIRKVSSAQTVPIH